MRNTDDILNFDFRIIKTENGAEVIDRNLKTPMDALTPPQQVEYMQVHSALTVSDALERRRKVDEAKKCTFSFRFKKALVTVCGIMGGLNA